MQAITLPAEMERGRDKKERSWGIKQATENAQTMHMTRAYSSTKTIRSFLTFFHPLLALLAHRLRSFLDQAAQILRLLLYLRLNLLLRLLLRLFLHHLLKALRHGEGQESQEEEGGRSGLALLILSPFPLCFCVM